MLFCVDELKVGCLVELTESNPIHNGRRRSAADELWTNGEVQFINQPGAEQRVVQFAAALTQEALHVPRLRQPTECSIPIKFALTEDFHLGRDRAETSQLRSGGAAGGQNDDR